MFRPVKENPSVHTQSYYAASVAEIPSRPSLDGDIDVDVCVVGAGLTGLGAALRLAQAGLKVAVIERAKVGWGASGRNGGQSNVGMRLPQDELERMVGSCNAKKLWQISIEARDFLKNTIIQYKIDCDYQSGLYRLIHKPSYLKKVHAYADFLNSKYGYSDIRAVSKEDVESVVATKIYHGGTYDSGSGHLHPLKFCLGLANAIESHGGLVFEQTEVLDLIERTDRCNIKTSQGSITASKVILAGDVSMKGLSKKVDSRVLPINSFMLATAPLGEVAANALIANRAAIVDSKFLVNYFRITPDTRLLFGGGETYSYRIPGDIPGFVRKHMAEVFPQLKDVTVDYGWSGTIGVTVNRLPFVRALSNNIVVASGYSGKGVLLAPYFGKILADAVMNDRSQLDVLGKLPSIKFPGGDILRWPMLVAGMSYYALRDKL